MAASDVDNEKQIQQFLLSYFHYQETGKKPLRSSSDSNQRGPVNVGNENDVINKIKLARETKKIIRVVGSGHSYAEAILDPNEKNALYLRLNDELRSFEILDKKCQNEGETLVKVGGGCYMEVNVLDKSSTLENSLNYQLHQADYALPILGGITRQSIAGFISTGSAGGSLKHSFADSIQEIHFINGKGEKQIATRDDTNPNLFNAVGVSMGLFGIITYVVLRVRKVFKVKGSENTVRKPESVLAMNDESGERGLKCALNNTDYFRLNWFPQKYANSVTEWRGAIHVSDDPIEPYTNVLSCEVIAGVASVVLMGIQAKLILVKDAKPYIQELVYKNIGWLLRLFISEHQTFHDEWYKILPMDNLVPVETYFKTQFTEMWFPMDQIDNVIGKLEILYEDQQVCGNYINEMYGAKKSSFWLSPAYDRDVMRVDIFWLERNLSGNPRDYYLQFWNSLLNVEGIRFHWGKFHPSIGKKYGNKTYDFKFLTQSYSKLHDWLTLRDDMDPDQIFVTNYWREMFNIHSQA